MSQNPKLCQWKIVAISKLKTPWINSIGDNLSLTTQWLYLTKDINVKFHMQCISNVKNNCCSFVMGSTYAFYSCERPEKRNCINFISYAYKLFYQFGQKEWSLLVEKPSKRQEFIIPNESLCMTTWEMTIFIQKDMFIVLFILNVSGLHTRVTICHGKRS